MPEPTILFEDDSVVVLNKPSGMIVHPDNVHDYPALTHWLEKKYPAHFLVHRLDRETSGVLAVAKTEAAHEFLKAQFQDREVLKVYRAFVYGIIGDDRGIIDKPIGNARGGRGPRSATRPHGTTRDAVTMFKVLERGNEVTYVEVRPKTGRTHQIRVHFAAIQRPVLCDQLYAPTRPSLLGFERLALHALSLAITLPSGEERTFTAPLPPDFLVAEGKLRV
jgi:23S rRNA pseudouridine1911/1915/1917 synthase